MLPSWSYQYLHNGDFEKWARFRQIHNSKREEITKKETTVRTVGIPDGSIAQVVTNVGDQVQEFKLHFFNKESRPVSNF